MALSQSQQPFVAVTLVDVVGSAPQNQGARMLVTAQGLHWGTVGGGKIEARALQEAQALLRDSRGSSHHFYEWNLQRDIGMTCGGVGKFYFEVHGGARDWSIAVFGAGHVAQALVPLLASLNCQLWVCDSRSEWLERLSAGGRIPADRSLNLQQREEPASLVAELPRHSFMVSMTMGHAHDVPILAQALRLRREDPQAFPFMGVIGSPAKAGAIRKDLRQQGFSSEELTTLVCPVGLPLGSNAPAEIAISITAQLLQERDRIFETHQKWERPAYKRLT